MKSIQLLTDKETVELNGMEREVDMSTKELIRLSLNNQPQGGFSIDDMMRRLRIREELEKVNGEAELALEDADYNSLATYAKDMRWGFVSRFIVDFVKQFY